MPSPSPPTASNAPAVSKETLELSSTDGNAVPTARAAWLTGPAGARVGFLALAILGAALDLWTKQVVFAWRGLPRHGNEWWIWEGYIGIETSLNRGALFGMGEGHSMLFAGVSILAAAGVFYWVFWGGADRSLWLTIALGAVTGGIIGNLYDRLGLWANESIHPEWRSAVRDWILFRYGEYTWPNFNIADSLLVCGAVMIAWQAFSTPTAPQEASESRA